MSWETIVAELRRWHETHDWDAGRATFTFLETELRGMIPGPVRREWPGDLVEDALRGFLLRLLKERLPAGIANPRPYLARAFRNHCIDLDRARRGRRECSVESQPAGWEPPGEDGESPAAAAQQREQVQRLHAALRRLEIADRVVLKLEHAPELLDDEEARWLAARAKMDDTVLRRALETAEDVHAITRIFDPGDDDPGDPVLRRKRMERFRRRHARALAKLRQRLQEDP
jgi:DNA-directed RNA polymerase specialized sigma24 family protein